MAELLIATYSIAACDPDSRQWGVATQSKFLGVGSVVPWAEPGVGAIAPQSYANPRYGPEGLALLRSGLPAEEVAARLTAADEGREHRQLGVVDAEGRSATFTGSECHAWAGGRTGPGYAVQGNILVSEETVTALESAFLATAGRPLAERLIDCLTAAQAAGGDSRGQQSAALLVVEKDGGYAGLSDSLVDLRVDDHEQPIEELRRIYGLHQAIFGKTPRSEWTPADEPLRAELAERLAGLGYDGDLADAFAHWAGTENLEERVDGVQAIDPVVLEDGTVVRAVGAKAGEVFEPSGWEWAAIAFSNLRAGRVEEGRKVMLEGVAANEGHWAAHFNLACFEILSGRPEESLAALRR